MSYISNVLIAVLLYFIWRIYKSRTTPITLVFCPNTKNLQLLKQCPALFQPIPNKADGYISHANGSFSTLARYVPPFWLLNAHIHTLWGALARRSLNLPYTRDILTTPDNGTLSVDWFNHPQTGKNFDSAIPTVVVLHGLTGGSFEPYIQHMAQHAFNTIGMRTVVINYRGCAETAITSHRTYCATNTEDFRQALEHIRSKTPNAPLFAIGFSLGSVILVKYLSQVGADHPFLAAASISNPMDLNEASLQMQNRLLVKHTWNRYLARNLMNVFSRWKDHWDNDFDVDMKALGAARTLRELDSRLTTRVWSYATVEDYYHDASPSKHLNKVACRLLCLNSKDDFITYIHGEDLLNHFKTQPNIILGVSEWGGHLGFLDGSSVPALGGGPSWTDKAVVQYFSAILSTTFPTQQSPHLTHPSTTTIIDSPSTSILWSSSASLSPLSSPVFEDAVQKHSHHT